MKRIVLSVCVAVAVAVVVLLPVRAGEIPITCVQTNLIACWDGIANDGEGGHASSLNNWTDLSGRYSFVFNANSGIAVDDMALVFPGTQAGYAKLSAANTDVTFEAAKNGTFEIVLQAGPTTTQNIVLQSSSQAGIALGEYGSRSSAAAAAQLITGISGCPIVSYNWSSAITTFALTYSSAKMQTAWVNAAKATQSGSNGFGSQGNDTFLGHRASLASGQAFQGKVYAIRLYSEKLSADEIAWNHAYDRMRFEGLTPAGAFAGLTPPPGLTVPTMPLNVTVTNETGEAVLSLDGGNTWFAGTNGWFGSDEVLSVTVRDDMRRMLEFSDVPKTMQPDGTVLLPLTDRFLVAKLQEKGTRRWNADYTDYEYLVTVTNVSNEAVLFTEQDATRRSTLSVWVGRGTDFAFDSDFEAMCARGCRYTYFARPANFVPDPERLAGRVTDVTAATTVCLATFTPTHVWSGAGETTSFDDPANWNDRGGTPVEAPPGEGSVVYIPAPQESGVTVSVDCPTAFTNASMFVGADSGLAGMVTLTVKHKGVNRLSGSFVLLPGATITHEAVSSSADTLAAADRRLWLEARDIIVEAGAVVTADDKGYAAQKGPGASNGHTAGGWHATQGYNPTANTLPTTADGPRGIYGCIREPTAHGSGGQSTRGGGAIRLNAQGTLWLNGVVRANASSTGWGLGAGGSVWLTAGAIIGGSTGSVAAYAPASGNPLGGAGRISLVQTMARDWSAFKGTIEVPDPKLTRVNSPTIYQETAADAPGCGTLRVAGCKNNDQPDILTPRVSDASQPFRRVLVETNGRLTVGDGVTLRVTEEVKSSGLAFSTSGDGAVELMPAAGEAATVSGTLTLKHLTATNAGSTVSFAKGCQITSSDNGSLYLVGTETAPLTLTGPDGEWKLNVGANVDASVSFVNVSNCNSSAGAAIADAGGVDLGGTVNWTFPHAIQPNDPLVWTGAAGSTAWGDGGNWQDRYGDPRAPTATDVLRIPAGCAVYPVLTFAFAGNSLTNETGASLTLDGGTLTLSGDFVCAGSFTCKGYETWEAGGTVDFTGATVTPGTSRGVLSAAGAQRFVAAGATFYDLALKSSSLTLLGGFTAHEVTCDQNAAVSLVFEQGKLFKAGRYRMIPGTGSISLASTEQGRQWRLSAGTGSVFDGVAAQDSDAREGDPVCVVSYVNKGNNLNWYTGASIWTGAADSVWTNPENWTGSVPGVDSDVFIKEGTSAPKISEPTTIRSLALGGGESSVTLTVRGALTVQAGLAVSANGTLVADAPIVVSNNVLFAVGSKVTHTSGGSYRVDITALGDIQIDKDANVDTLNCGFVARQGPGGTDAYVGGGTHASWGHKFGDNKLAGKGVYGNIRAPIVCGSGGESGSGGGAVHLCAKGVLAVNGMVCADSKRDAWGGGSAGSIWLEAGTIRGSGFVSAVYQLTTGNSSTPSAGRVSLVQTVARDWSAFTGKVNDGLSAKSSPGTIYWETAADRLGEGELEVRGVSGMADSPVRLTPAVEGASQPFRRVTVGAYGRLVIEDGVTLRVTERLQADGTSFATSGDGAVELMPAAGATATVSGTLKLKHLIATNAGSTVSFAKGCSITNYNNGSLHLSGTAQAPLMLTGPDGEWKLDVGANVDASVSFVNVSNCNSSAGTAIADAGGKDLGGTLNWTFPHPIQPNDPLVWTGAAGSTAWGDSGNWQDQYGDSRAPTATDALRIPAGCAFYPVLTFASAGGSLAIEAGASLALDGGALTLSGDFICAGSFTCAGYETWEAGGTVDFTGATVVSGTSRGVLSAADAQRFVAAGATFYDLALKSPSLTLLGGFAAHEVTCDQNAAVSLVFEQGKLFKAGRYRMITGTGSITLASTEQGSQWRLAAGTGSVFDGVAVSDSNALEGDPVCTVFYVNNGNNLNWFDGASVWTGEADTAWTNAANWRGGVPGVNSDVFISEGVSAPKISEPTTIRSLSLGGGESSVTLTVRGALTVRAGLAVSANGTLVADAPIVASNNVLLAGGSKVTHTSGGAYRVDITAMGDILIDKDANIDTLNCGYAAQRGPGGTDAYCGGGTYASWGKSFDSNKLAGKGVYGSIRAPVDCGSGGGSGTAAGPGGGAVHLCAKGVLAVNGEVNADSKWDGYCGGTGGSIWLEAGTIRGSGIITAIYQYTTASCSTPSAGRISLVQRVARDWSAFACKVNEGFTASSSPGTIYWETAADRPGEGELEIRGVATKEISPVRLTPAVTDGNEPFGKVTLKPNGCFSVVSGATLRVSQALAAGGASWNGAGAVELCPRPGEPAAVSGTFTCGELVSTNAHTEVEFAAGTKVTVAANGLLNLNGQVSRGLRLKSSAEGEPWYLTVKPDAKVVAKNLDVSDSDASEGVEIVAKYSVDKRARNVNWQFKSGMLFIVK